jgi:3-dehydroquinate synthase
VRKLRVTLKSPVQDYRITIGRTVLGSVGVQVRRELGPSSRRAIIISNRRVFALYGEPVIEGLQASAFVISQALIGEGERFKSLTSLNRLVTTFSELGLERNDAVVALGGGVVGDLAGFAAAVYLRGIPYFQVPTTLLAQIDSSVGGKTGVNLPVGKNLVGAFHQPRGVIIDTDTLATLPARELTAGWCEMIKNGAVGSRQLFQQTTNFLRARKQAAFVGAHGLDKLIAAHCAFKAGIVAGDERESLKRTDRASRRILNFGHTIGHALEAVTRYRRFRHGEAVGYGMLAAGEISKLLGLLKPSELELLREAIELCGPLPRTGDLNERSIISALGRDKKSIAGKVQWILLERIGTARIVDGNEIGPSLLHEAVRTVLKN